MKTNLTPILIAGVALALVAPAAALPLADDNTATVTLEVDYENYTVDALGGSVACDVTVPADAVVADVLDQATLDQCINGWTWSVFPTMLDAGRYVTGIDGRAAECTVGWAVGACTFWVYYVQGPEDEEADLAPVGVDLLPVEDGATYAFVFDTWTG